MWNISKSCIAYMCTVQTYYIYQEQKQHPINILPFSSCICIYLLKHPNNIHRYIVEEADQYPVYISRHSLHIVIISQNTNYNKMISFIDSVCVFVYSIILNEQNFHFVVYHHHHIRMGWEKGDQVFDRNIQPNKIEPKKKISLFTEQITQILSKTICNYSFYRFFFSFSFVWFYSFISRIYFGYTVWCCC